MSDYWLISAPGDKTCQQTWETMNNMTAKQNSLSVNYKFHIPDLKVGTLDQLVGLSDDLGKLDNVVEQVTRKVATYLGEVLEDQRDKLHENLMANNSQASVEGESTSAEDDDRPKNESIGTDGQDGPQQTRDSNIGQHHHASIIPKRLHHRSSASEAEAASSSCYHANWCTASTPSTPSPPVLTPNNPASPCASCSSAERFFPSDDDDDERRRRQQQRRRRASRTKKRSSSSRSKSPGEEESEARPEGADCGCRLPNPGDLSAYIERFQWDMAKYPIKQSLRNIADIISKQVTQIEADLKSKSTIYNNLKGSLQSLEKKQTGSLLTRNLAELVKREHFILDSEYLSTLLVIVPRANFQDWNSGYEKITDMIVPRSSQLITQDSEYGLFTVTLFKKVMEEFKLHAREKKFIVRDFTYNEEELAAGKNELTKLATDKKKQFGPLVRWLKVNFSECFCAWIHVKALRVFVESVLRYGLPVNFIAILIHPNKKSTKRLRDVLNQLYAHLDSSTTSTAQANQDSIDIPGLGFGSADYYPYVFYKINLDLIEK